MRRVVFFFMGISCMASKPPIFSRRPEPRNISRNFGNDDHYDDFGRDRERPALLRIGRDRRGGFEEDDIHLHYYFTQKVYSSDDELRDGYTCGASGESCYIRTSKRRRNGICKGTTCVDCPNTGTACIDDKFCCGVESCWDGKCQPNCGYYGKKCSASKACCDRSRPCNTKTGDCPKLCQSDGDSCGAQEKCCNPIFSICFGGKCEKCHNNGEACRTENDCCYKQSICSKGKCKGCKQVGEYLGRPCGSNSDCCNGSCSSGGHNKGSCYNPTGTCTMIGGGCFFKPSSCCKGTTCGNSDGGYGVAWRTCQRDR